MDRFPFTLVLVVVALAHGLAAGDGDRDFPAPEAGKTYEMTGTEADRCFARAMALLRDDPKGGGMDAVFLLQRAVDSVLENGAATTEEQDHLRKLRRYLRWQQAVQAGTDGGEGRPPSFKADQAMCRAFERRSKAGKAGGGARPVAQDDAEAGEPDGRAEPDGRKVATPPARGDTASGKPAAPVEVVAKAKEATPKGERDDAERTAWCLCHFHGQAGNEELSAQLAGMLRSLPDHTVNIKKKRFEVVAAQVRRKHGDATLRPELRALLQEYERDLLHLHKQKQAILRDQAPGIPLRIEHLHLDATMKKVDEAGVTFFKHGSGQDVGGGGMEQDFFLGWELLREDDFLRLAEAVVPDNRLADLEALAALDMRLGQFHLGRTLLRRLQAADAAHFKRYTEQVQQCEQAYQAYAGQPMP